METLQDEIKKTGLRVIRLKATNFQKLSAVEVTPKGSIVKIKGENGVGKTSVMNALFAALGGKSASPDEPIKNGKEKAEVFVDLDHIRVNKTWMDGSEKLVITTKDGAVVKKPQSLLDEFVGKYTIDVGGFLALAEKDQVEILKNIVDLGGLDLEKHEEKRQEIYDDRTDVNRDEKRARSTFESLDGNIKGPQQETSATKLMEEFEEAQGTIRLNNLKRNDLTMLKEKGENIKKTITELKARLSLEERDLEKMREAYRKDLKVVDALVDPDTAELQEKMATVEKENKKIVANRDKKKALKKADELKIEADELTAKIDKMDKKKVDALANAKFPVKNLSWTEEGITLNDLPFSQASQSERLKTAVAIACQSNPHLKVVTIKDASLFDKNSIEDLRKFSEKKGITAWLEIVSNAGNGKLVIEEG